MIAAGCAALLFCGVCWLEAAIYQAMAGGSLAWLAPASIRLAAGRIAIPRIGIDAAIREGDSAQTLLLAVGHMPGTALPGEPGNVVLSGHRDSYFRNLHRVRRGDLVTITTPGATWSYRVESIAIVTPDRTDLLQASDRPTLTLITCYPFDWIGPAPRRFVVRAREVAPRPSTPRPGGVSGASGPSS